MTKSKIAYFYDAEVGNFYYGQVIHTCLLLVCAPIVDVLSFCFSLIILTRLSGSSDEAASNANDA
jgi:hypothetical protein